MLQVMVPCHQGLGINPEDIARLSPLGYRHFNMLGRYHFELAENLQKGGFRPLSTLSDLSGQD